MYQKVELAALASMPDADIDMSDIPDTKVFPNPRRGVFSDSPKRKVGARNCPILRRVKDCAGKFDDDHGRHGDVTFLAMMLPEYWTD